MTAETWTSAWFGRAWERTRLAAMSWPILVFLITFVATCASHTRVLNTDGYMTLIGGREVWLHGLPNSDVLTVAGAGRRWVDQQWLGQIAIYSAWRTGGYAAVAISCAASTAAAFALLCRLLLERGAGPRRAVKWTALAFAGTIIDVSVRAQDLAYPLFLLILAFVVGDMGNRPATWRRLLPPLALLILWANVHGSVLAGAALFGTHCAYRAITRRGSRDALRYVACAVAAPLTVLVTPNGAAIVDYYRSVLVNPEIRAYSAEWKPPAPDNLAALGYLAVLVAVIFVVVNGMRAGARPRVELLALTMAFGVAGLTAIRWDGWAAMLAVVLATDVLNTRDPRPQAPSPVPIGVSAAALAAALAVVTSVAAAQAGSFLQRTPTGAIGAAYAYCSSHPSARILGDDYSSSALLWLHPGLRQHVAFDGQLEVYSQQQLHRWLAYILGRPGSLSLGRDYQVFVVSSANRALAHRLEHWPAVRLIYRGADGLVAVRRGHA